MKKLMFLMMALLVAPAMATVTISVEPIEGECAANIVVTADDADTVDGLEVYSLVAGIALDVSVTAGVIESVTGFMMTGESRNDAAGYGIYMGTITFTGDDPEAIANVGTPVAPASAPDSPGQLRTAAIVLEFGCLFNVNTPEAAPLARTVLCRVNLSETATVELGENATRGGVVLIGGGAPSGVVLLESGDVICPTGVCYTGPDLDEWIAVGSPESWCKDYQCHGDADDATEQVTRPIVRVGYNDINILLVGFNQPYSGSDDADGGDPDALPDTWIAADFDHATEQVTRPIVRIGYNDIGILLHYFNDANGAPPADCQTASPVVP